MPPCYNGYRHLLNQLGGHIMENKSQIRYTDRELIALLWQLASDYNKKPTYREILADKRLPTHHTYINRFGSVKEAFRLADIDLLEDKKSALNVVYDTLVEKFGADNIKFILNDETRTHFEISIKETDNDRTVYLDFIDLTWNDSGDHRMTIDEIKKLREFNFFSNDPHGEYYQADSIMSLYSAITNIH
ncbi:hypothetical protein BpsS140_00040 [Bacillus phage vB_BpsS-140]|nr:hypothetical protein BpsS140_00040 [Bacillus phage vB_BpsS-140]